jgi:glycerol-3-phosphate dehydrogenase (NAD(P)+)
MSSIGVIGAGSWGTALAHSLAEAGHAVRLWAYEEEVVESIRNDHENRLFFPGIALNERIDAVSDLEKAVTGADFILTVMPSHVCRALYQQMLPFLTPEMTLVSATKGLETASLMRMSEVILDVVRHRFIPRLAVVSGPSFAYEVAHGDPTAIVVASTDSVVAQAVQSRFSSKGLRLYASDDVVGVELGGAVKNVIAIAAGVIEGLGLGHNPKAALITRGLAEMTRLALACGGKRETLAGLAGMGDLVLTCTGNLSRNRAVGAELGKGKKLRDIIAATNSVAEGVTTTGATVALANMRSIEMPITEQIDRVLKDQISPVDAIRQLMERSLKTE